MKILKSLFASLILIALFPSQTYASHAVATDLTYECIGEDTFSVNLIFYWDCLGNIGAPDDPSIDITSDECGQSFTIDMFQLPSGDEVTPLCSDTTILSTCVTGDPGDFPGVQQYIYNGILILPQECSDWTMEYQICCRNEAITNIEDSDLASLVVQATVNNTFAACNTSPTWEDIPVTYACAGQGFNYNFGALDLVDGDSLGYTLIDPFYDPGQVVTFMPGLTAENPMETIPPNSFTFDPSTGQISATFAGSQFGLISVLVEEFDDNGNLVGTLIRDIQIIVVDCENNQVPNDSIAPTLTTTSNGVQLDENSFEVCPGDTLQFSFTVNDPDLLDTLNVESNIGFTLPGATFNYSGTNPVTIDVEWIPMVIDTGIFSFTVSIADDACPIPGGQIFQFDINLPVGYTGPNQAICIGESAQIEAYGGDSYSWSPTNGLSNPNGPSPQANPIFTTMYYVDILNDCGAFRDSVLVTVNPLPIANAGDNISFCEGDQGQLNGNFLLGGTIEWTPAMGLTCTDCPNPIVNLSNTGTTNLTQTYTYSATNSLTGCVNADNVTVTVFPLPDVNAGDSLFVCQDSTIQLEVTNSIGLNTDYVWEPADFLSNPNNATPVANIEETVTYTVTGTDSNGCIDNDDVTVYFGPTPNVGINPTAQPPIPTDDGFVASPFVYLGGTINLQGTGANTYIWTDITNGAPGIVIDTIRTLVPSPETNTIYLVCGFDEYGCVAYEEVSVEVKPIIDVFIPNSFTPNGDGTNDLFSIWGIGFPSLVGAQIFNRWGELIHEEPSGDFAGFQKTIWDGRIDGKDEIQPVGTYAYLIQALDGNGKVVTKAGNISILK